MRDVFKNICFYPSASILFASRSLLAIVPGYGKHREDSCAFFFRSSNVCRYLSEAGVLGLAIFLLRNCLEGKWEKKENVIGVLVSSIHLRC